MKLHRISVAMLAALCVCQFAHSEEHRDVGDDRPGDRGGGIVRPAVTHHGEAYATISAMIDYCSRVDERHRDNYESLGAATLQKVAGKGDTSNDAGYYEKTIAPLWQMPTSTGIKDCTAAIGVKPGNDH